MEEQKKNVNNANLGQTRMPPRPMPPRPPKVASKPEEKKVEVVEEVEELPRDSENEVEEVVEEEKVEQSQETTNEDETINPPKKEKKSKKENPNRANQRAKEKFNKKKFIIVLVSVLASIIFAGGIALLIIFLLPGDPLAKPENLRVYQSGNSSYAVCDPVGEAIKYDFFIDGKKYQTTEPILDLVVLTEPKTYQIYVVAYGEKRKSDSPHSEVIEYTHYESLAAPIIYEEPDNTLSWAKVEGATSYELVYNDSTLDVGNVSSFDLTKLGGGAYNIKLRAKSNKNGILPSVNSNNIVFTYYEKLSGVGGALLEGNKVFVNYVKNASSYVISINGREFAASQPDEVQNFIFDPNLFEDITSVEVTNLTISAIGEGYFISSTYQVELQNN